MGVRLGWEGEGMGGLCSDSLQEGGTPSCATPLLVAQLGSELSHAVFPGLIHYDGNGCIYCSGGMGRVYTAFGLLWGPIQLVRGFILNIVYYD